VVLISALLSACATHSAAPVTDSFSSSTTPSALKTAPSVKEALYRGYDHWRGTRYRTGGMDGNGFDCSGLTSVLYRDLFDRALPRTTRGQAGLGRPVPPSDLAAGDLVFFKTGLRRRHVGIYVEKGLFLHASRSDGVRLSDLRDGYWRRHYWMARRVNGI
jgi:cell wall-associated NlpC family hydrolase